MSNVLCLDVENGSEYRVYDDKEFLDLSPFNPNNQLVSVGVAALIADGWEYSKSEYYCFNHSTQAPTPKGNENLQAQLDWADVIVGHNIKHDLKWLYACGFTYTGKVWDTQVVEYILQRGAKKPLNLAALAEEHDLPRKKTDLIQSYMDEHISFYNIPWEIIEEYGVGDIETTCALYDLQVTRMDASPHLIPTANMTHEFLQVLVEMETNGVAISQEALDIVKEEYRERQSELDRSLHERIYKVMGEVPVNLNSPDFCSELFYSRKIVDKRKWKTIFNIGADSRGKSLKPPLMNPAQFNRAVRSNTTIIKIPKVDTCYTCGGTGHVEKLTVKGVPYKVPPKCSVCGGAGVLFTPTNATAGLRLSPMSTIDTSAAGFRADKTTLLKLKDTSPSEFVRKFIDDFIELSAINTYLSTFVHGINRFKHGSILHSNLNQTITATGRLSSSAPNLQNMPRGNTFPVKKCFMSRFDGGTVIEADYSGLEFRMAGHLSGCPSVRRYVDEAIDPHAFTRDYINNFDPSLPQITRQDAKSDCFPLYTEILTPSGWKKYNEIKIGDNVINYNSSTKELEYDTVIDYTPPHFQPVIRMKTKHNWAVDSTPEHRWYCTKRVDHGKAGRNYEDHVVLTKDIHSEHRIITSAKLNDTPFMGVDDAARIAWLWSDGSISKNRIAIVQKKYTNEVEELFKDFITSYSEKDGCRNYNLTLPYTRSWLTSLLGADIYDKSMASQLVLGMGSSAREAWLRAMKLAEGTQRKYGEWRIAQNSGPIAEAIKLCATLCGYSIRVTKFISKVSNKQHEQITLRSKSYVTGQRIVKENLGEQEVWCVTTNNRTVIIKQGEVITISGQTFKPLYGGSSGSPRQQAYYKGFLIEHYGVAAWQEELKKEAMRTKMVRLPTGREYVFPYARRLPNGYVNQTTQIVNYPVQGFATGDVVPCGIIAVNRLFKKRGLASLLILTVHDSLYVDTYPGEEEEVIECLKLGMLSIDEMFQEFYGIRMAFPIAIEIKQGYNAFDMKEIKC